MSRSWKVLFAVAALTPAPTIAQTANSPSEADRVIAEKMMSASGRITPDTSHNNCLRTARQGEIVVCAPDEDKYRIPSTAESDPTGARGTDDGRLHPPDVSGLPDCSKGGCIGFGRAPRHVYMIDLSQIPVAPAGSDADKIAKGEVRAP